MLPLRLVPANGAPLTVLAVGAHSDDVEIGSGGTLLTLAAALPEVRAHVVVLSATPTRAGEAQAGARRFLPGGRVDVEVHDLPDGRYPGHWAGLKDRLEELARRVRPDLILAPRLDDAHQDHRTVARLVRTVWRDHLVLGYEIPKYDGDLPRPNLYVPLTAEVLQEKLRLLRTCFPSQADRDWFDDEVFRGLARLRGVESRCRYAEGFEVTKLVLAPDR